MQFFNNRENTLKPTRSSILTRLRCPANSLMDHLTGEENPTRLLIELGLLVLLLHVVLIAYLRQTPEPETPAEPLVMEVALIAAPAPAQAKPAPPAPAAAKPKPRPVPAKPKKAPALPKKTPVLRQPALKPAPTSAPAATAETAATSAPAVAAPASPTAAAPAPPKAAPFTEANYRANYQSNPKPEYPRLAKSRGWQGKVLLRVQVTADGRSASVQVQQSSGHKQLDEAAVEAVENWTFLPAKRGATPVASTVTVPIQFKLNP
jgi:protein TonB